MGWHLSCALNLGHDAFSFRDSHCSRSLALCERCGRQRRLIHPNQCCATINCTFSVNIWLRVASHLHALTAGAALQVGGGAGDRSGDPIPHGDKYRFYLKF
jgi:hypothetical protein